MFTVGGQTFKHAPDWLDRWLIVLTRVGGHVYGTSVAGSDLDYRGIFVQPPKHVYGIESYDLYGPDNVGLVDLCCYSLQEFVRMCLWYNPHPLEVLWTPLDMHERCAPAWHLLYDLRSSFLSRAMAEPFCAYAGNCLRRAVTGARDFGWTPQKNAMHAVRVLRMGLEALTECKLNVIRSDADYLLAIRRGEVPVEDACAECERLERAIRDAAISSALPAEPNRALINRAVVSITRAILQNRS